MIEPFPVPQPSDLPAAAAPKKRKKWPWLVGAPVLVLALAAAFGEDAREQGDPVTAASPTGQAAVPIVPAPATSAASAAPASLATPVWNSAPAATNVSLLSTAVPAPALAVVFSPARQQDSSSRRNAIRSAQQYLEFSAFSRSGLIDQLEYEGFSTEDATFAVDSLNVDWNEQAAKSARQYLEYTSFSRSGLIDQLVYEGFTHAQAEYGVNAAY